MIAELVADDPKQVPAFEMSWIDLRDPSVHFLRIGQLSSPMQRQRTAERRRHVDRTSSHRYPRTLTPLTVYHITMYIQPRG